jgi:hypothetical protein
VSVKGHLDAYTKEVEEHVAWLKEMDERLQEDEEYSALEPMEQAERIEQGMVRIRDELTCAPIESSLGRTPRAP